MGCPHLLLIWKEKARYDYDTELMQCASCGNLMQFDKHYKEVAG